MTIFELVKIALDELYKEGEKRYGPSLDVTIKKQIDYLTDSHGQPADPNRDPVDYRDPATRFAYVYKYVAAHGDYLVQVMEELIRRLKKTIFREEKARISCVGGGPGSDIIGILKYLDEHKDEPIKKLSCYLLDKEQAWADTWTELGDSLETGFAVNVNYQALDVTCVDSWSAQTKFLGADLITMSYFVSEIFNLDDAEFWKKLFEGAKPGALFLYNDNAGSTFADYFDEQWEKAGLTPIVIQDNVRFTPRYSEQASELGDYLIKFGQFPKIKGKVSYRVLRKDK